MSPITIIMPNYITEVKVSEAQRPKYWVWDGNNIKAGKKKLLKRYLKDKYKEETTCTPAMLADDYKIAAFLGDKIVLKVHEDIHISNIEVIKAAIKNKTTAIKLTDKQVDKLRFYLIDKDNNLIIDNEDKVGKPRFLRIKGQEIYNGNLGEFNRAHIMNGIKDYMTPYVQSIPVITEFPLEIIMEFHTYVKMAHDKAKHKDKAQRWDVDNHGFPYCKAFPDLLKELGKIPDDDRLHITIPCHPVYVPIPESQETKLIITIKQDTRKVLTANEYYAANFKFTNLTPKNIYHG